MDLERLENWLEQNRIGRWQAAAPMAEYTSWKIGGPAGLMVWPRGEAQFAALLSYCGRENVALRFLGAGTNLLAADAGVTGLVAHTGELTRLVWEGEQVEAGAGLALARLSAEAARRGLSGLEFAIGIPGSVGGALAMNAGAYGGQLADVTESVRVLDRQGEPRVLERDELAFSYRGSSLRAGELLILSGRLRLAAGDAAESQALMEKYLDDRRRKQPLALPSGGSVFRNPAGDGAGRYIEAAGLKGLRAGSAQISPQHANFIVNLGGATAADVRTLMRKAEEETAARFGVTLESEIVYWE